jgi:fatty-acyl-CoA synthase
MSEMGSGIHMPFDAAYMAANTHAVGFQAPYLEVMLASSSGEAVAPGDVGEIWMRGPSVSPGYWNQPEATAVSKSGDWFRSGDLARQQDDGAYVIVDRLKDMYISGGENVYPAEVEVALKLCPGVEDAAVAGVPDARWGEVGAAFIQLIPGAKLSPEDVREHCSTRLARYKRPVHVRFVEALPRTGSGKVLKNRLLEGFKPL